MDCEVLLCPQTAGRGRAILGAMIACAATAGVKLIVGEQYTASSKWLMTYGLGHAGRRSWVDSHLRSGGRVIGWDLGYWDRDFAMRLTIDKDHPQDLLTDMDSSRFEKEGIELRNDFCGDGHIIIAALGRKTRLLLNDKNHRWENQAIALAQQAYPDRKIVYRSKRPEKFQLIPQADGTIESVLKGASLVICRHSNIAVDACIAGIPVVCSDGIASALYGNDVVNVIQPDYDARLRFLQNVAWWQWRPTEALLAWKHIIKILN